MYSIQEIVSESGFSRRTIHKYRKEGLLSPPLRRNTPNDARVWGDVHLRELRKIRQIREQNRTLADIRELLHPSEA